MRAFHNDPEFKDFILTQLAAHRKTDKLIKGTYWENGHGCGIGCTLEAVWMHNGKPTVGINHESHILYESELGIPQIIARLEDRFFEALPACESQAWPERFTRAIKPGADLSMVWPRFALWLLTEEVPLHTKNKRALASLAEVAALYRKWVEGKKPSDSRWQQACSSAAKRAGAAGVATNTTDAASVAYVADAAYAAYAAAAAYGVYTDAANATAAADAAADANAAYAAYAAAAANAAYAAYAAYAADAAAADAAADANAAYAAYAAAATAAYAAAASAAYVAAAYAAAASATAKINSYRRQSNKLIELLEAA